MCRYKYTHGEEISSPAVASLLGTILYNRRFFPIYALNVLAGLDEEGECCYCCYHFIIFIILSLFFSSHLISLNRSWCYLQL